LRGELAGTENSLMDTSVLAALAKWPDVPDVFGWLSLTARGEWRLRGEPIGNAAIREFIGRNYACDEAGLWFFQNGPQRVFVSLDATPWVVRLHDVLLTHTGTRVHECRAAVLLDDGRLVLGTEFGAAIVDDRDSLALSRAIEGLDTLDCDALGCVGATLPVTRATLDACAVQFGFVREPRET
jgi:hypothetical protein